jgi:hypothetical protein
MLFIALAGVLLNALDCYGAWITSKQARDCCRSGHCSPANHDPCCKISPSPASQVTVHQQKTQFAPPAIAAAAVAAPAAPLAAVVWRRIAVDVDASPPHGLRANNLPLLI